MGKSRLKTKKSEIIRKQIFFTPTSKEDGVFFIEKKMGLKKWKEKNYVKKDFRNFY